MQPDNQRIFISYRRCGIIAAIKQWKFSKAFTRFDHILYKFPAIVFDIRPSNGTGHQLVIKLTIGAFPEYNFSGGYFLINCSPCKECVNVDHMPGLRAKLKAANVNTYDSCAPGL